MWHTRRIKSTKFDGDIIITDPCYILYKYDTPGHEDDWEKCDYGDNVEAIGIHNYIINGTIYGDWSCHTFEKKTHKVLGRFCADSGMVGIFDLKEILNYNPNYSDPDEKPWTATLIKNFSGRVWIEEHWDDKDTNNWKSYIKVVGSGVDKVTGEKIEFFTSQTGL